MKIAAIDCHILVDPGLREDATSSAQDDLIVIVRTDEGTYGIGETDTGPWLAKAAIEAPGSHSMARSMKDLLIGRDPFDTSAIWETLYTSTAMSGRRGPVICAMGAIDMALWDLKGKALGLPVHKLLGGAVKKSITPYASLQPSGKTVQEYGDSLLAWSERAAREGFGAAKLECTLGGPYAHEGLRGTDEEMTEIIRDCRRALGPEFKLMVDVQYLWYDAKSALRTLSKWEDLDLFFLETPLQIDNLEGYSILAREAPMRIAAGEWQTTRFEMIELMDRGGIDVVQPDIGRVGGLTEAVRVAHLAQDRGRLLIPHCWKTGIGIAASVHLAATLPHCPLVEFLPPHLCNSALRAQLVEDCTRMEAGGLRLPDRPGLGIELNWDAFENFQSPSNG